MNQTKGEREPQIGGNKIHHEINVKNARELIKVIDLLKQAGFDSINSKFRFKSNLEKKIFEETLKEEVEDIEDNNMKKRNNPIRRNYKQRKEGQLRKGCTFPIGSHLRCQIFLNAYRKKLKKLQTESKVKIYKWNQDLFIESEVGVKLESIVFCEIMEMYKRLKIYIFFGDAELSSIVSNSEFFINKLEKLGIFYHRRRNTRNNVAFYSKEFEYQQIRKQVLKEKSLKPSMVRLYDVNLSYTQNSMLFRLLQKSMKSTINSLKENYQIAFEMNNKNSCFVLHPTHSAFIDGPLSQIKTSIQNTIFFSFNVDSGRKFIQTIKKKFFPFCWAKNLKNRVFCCIDKRKIESKAKIIQFLAKYLSTINFHSRLVVYLNANTVITKNRNKVNEIKQLAITNGLFIYKNKQKEREQTNIIQIIGKSDDSRYSQLEKQKSLGNLLLKLLYDSDEISLEEILKHTKSKKYNLKILKSQTTQYQQQNQSLSNTENIQNDRQEKQFDNDYLIEQQDNLETIDNSSKQSDQVSKEANKEKTFENQHEASEDQKQDLDYPKDFVEQKIKQIIEEKIQIRQINKNFSFVFKLQILEFYEGQQFYQKDQRDRKLQNQLRQNLSQKIKAWKIKPSLKFLKLSEEEDSKIFKESFVLVSDIKQNSGQKCSQLIYKSLEEMKNNETAYAIYQSQSNFNSWIPTHILQKIN